MSERSESNGGGGILEARLAFGVLNPLSRCKASAGFSSPKPEASSASGGGGIRTPVPVCFKTSILHT